MSRKTAKNDTLPKEWQQVKLGEVGIFSKGSGITKNELVDHGIPCICYGELYTKHYFRVRNFHSFIADTDETKRKILKNNDLLFAGSGETREEIGKCASFNSDIRVYAGGDVIICSVDPKKLRADFASYYLNTIGRRQINKLGQGNSIVHIYSRFLENLEIALPPLSEQKAITSLLETWDTAIETIEHLLAAKEKQLNALYQRYFQPGSPGNRNWQSHRIGEFVNVRKERSVPTEEMPLYSLTIEDGVTAKTDRYKREFLVKDQQAKTYKVAHPRDIVFNPSNLRWGAIARSEVPTKVTLSPIYEVRGGSVSLNSLQAVDKWLSALVMPPPGLAWAG